MLQGGELNQLRGFILHIARRVLDPLFAEHLEPVRQSRSRHGLREAARDMVEACQDLPADRVAELDLELSLEGLPSLTAMRDRRHTRLLQVLEKARVESEEEFRVISSYLSDVGPDALNAEVASVAADLLLAYESQR